MRPFIDAPWSSGKREAVTVIWDWHDHVRNQCAFDSLEQAKAGFQEERQRFEKDEPLECIPVDLASKVRAIATREKLPLEWFASQLDVAHAFYGSFTVADPRELKEFVRNWVSPHAYLIATLADAANTWQRKFLDELGMAFFIVDSLVHLKEDLEQNRTFIPESEMEHAGISRAELKAGSLSEAMQRLLWKQSIRARDAFAQGQPLLKELDRKYRGSFKRNWLTGLELLNEFEKRKYDVWSSPLSLSGAQQFQIRLLSWIGKGARQSRM